MFILDQLAEQRIHEAILAGEFNNLPGQGKPLPEDDLSHIPEDMRMAFKILKNAGFIPAEIRLRSEIGTLEKTLIEERENLQRKDKLKRLQYLYIKLENSSFERKVNFALQEEYHKKMIDGLTSSS